MKDYPRLTAREHERTQHLICGGKPTTDEFEPYSEDEKRVCDYLVEIGCPGCGADPIGFLIASHNMLRQSSRVYRDALQEILLSASVTGMITTAKQALDWDLVRDGE